MTELSRSLLAAAREGLAPDPDAAARVRAKVAAAVAAGTAAATGSHAVAASTAPASPPVGAPVAAPASTAPTAAAGSSSLLLKLGAALLVVGVSAGIVVVGRDAERTPEVPQLSLPPDHADDVPPRVHVAAPNDPLALPDDPPVRATPAAQSSSIPPVQAAPPAPSVPAVERELATLSREVELIDLAMVSLRKNAPRAAIEAIRVFDRETFGKGQMAEEAAAIEIEARCTLREDVTAALADFDRTWPESAQRERIQTTCFARR